MKATAPKASSFKRKSKDGDEDGSKKRKPKKKKDPNTLKRAMSTFMFFSQAERDEVVFGVAMEFLQEIAKNSWVQYDYSRRLEESLDVLKTEMQELVSQQTNIITALNATYVMHEKKPKAEVSLWLENVEKVTSTVTKIEEVYGEIGRDFSLPHVLHWEKVERITKLVTEECGGLPLGIITVASAMREKDDVREWRNALEELKCSTMEIEGMDDQDYGFHDEYLVKYWIAEGLIHDMGDWEKEQDKDHTLLNGLIDVCMLVRKSPIQVVMHDLIRDLAIGITRKRPLFVVKAGMGIRGSIGVEEFTEEVEKISLMRNQIEMLSGESKCPKLSTLLLQGNPLSRNISHEFFNRMNSLKVLDLSETGIEYLPESVSNLENLCMLLLTRCKSLREVPSLAKLKRLMFLNLYNTGIKEVPHGIECLVNLKQLYVSSAEWTNGINAGGCNSLMLSDSNVKLNMGRCELSSLHCLSRLQHLQSCDIWRCSMKWSLPIGDNSTIIPSLPSIESLDLIDLPNLRGLCEKSCCLPHLHASET
ncbi:probable disease resistance protein At4g27220 [Magnolia sinica]|uniref:probable disease resistance protein At4g27220 n=1 Tax=Magnolia sinica TaxID=86752 RepID=UPI002659C9DB|nr:probable disease resistance protein At4g27220 [Magnolia sinica]